MVSGVCSCDKNQSADASAVEEQTDRGFVSCQCADKRQHTKSHWTTSGFRQYHTLSVND